VSDRPTAVGTVPRATHADDLAAERALRRLELTVVRRLDGLLHGDYLGLFPGPGSEPAEAREYVPGSDDVRRMDWNVTARTTVPHVRDLTADRELETWALVDATASMDFGTARMEKRDLAVAAVAAVGFLTARAGNRLGALLAHAGTVRSIPARSGRTALLGLLRELRSLPRTPPGGPAGPPLGTVADALRQAARRPGLVVVVSDFLDGLDDPHAPAWELPMRRLATRHQLLAVEVVDPRELSLPDVGLLTVVDPETGRRREVATASRRLRERYRLAAEAHRGAVRAAVRRTGAAHLLLRTDEDWVRAVARHVTTQRRLAAGAPTARAAVRAQARPWSAARSEGGTA
jgi:uncharacterized protein (DUF58 family)